jgi:hypothetical protein
MPSLHSRSVAMPLSIDLRFETVKRPMLWAGALRLPEGA